MKLKLAVALQAVAIAAMGVTASAMAPTISDFGSPVIADDAIGEFASGANHFVYPNALSLDGIVEDDTADDSEILWSYYTDGGRYMINGTDPIDLGTENPVNPGAKRIDDDDADPDSGDTDGDSITFRDVNLSPIGGPDVEVTEEGFVNPSGEVITLFASDGTTYSSHEFLAYTHKGGNDYLSAADLPFEPEMSLDFTAGAGASWTSAADLGNVGFANNNNGLSLTTEMAGTFIGEWYSPYGDVDMAQNKVYRLRMNVDTTADLPESTTPLWIFHIDNVKTGDIAGSDSRFAVDFLVLDNSGGANSAGLASGGRNNFELWWAPPSISIDSWNTNVFTTARATEGRNGMRFRFRVLDVPGATLGQNRGGTLNMSNLAVDSVDLDDLESLVGETLWDGSDINAGTYQARAIVAPNDTDITFGGGSVTISPAAGTSWDTEVVNLEPGDAVADTAPTRPDNYPIKWESDQLLIGRSTIAAENANGATNPPDLMGFTFDGPTNEIGYTSLLSAASDTIGMPTLQPEEYLTFFYTNSSTNTVNAEDENFDRLRHRLQFIGNSAVGIGITDNTGGVTVSSIVVQEIDLP